MLLNMVSRCERIKTDKAPVNYDICRQSRQASQFDISPSKKGPSPGTVKLRESSSPAVYTTPYTTHYTLPGASHTLRLSSVPPPTLPSRRQCCDVII